MATGNSETPQRSAPRVPAENHVWLQCRRANPPSTVNVANGLLDISTGGLQLLAREPLYAWDKVDIALGRAGTAAFIRRQGEVRWVLSLGGEACCAGVRFFEPLTAEELQALTIVASARDEVPAFDW